MIEIKPCYYFKILLLVCSVGNWAPWKSEHVKITCATQPYENEQKMKVISKSLYRLKSIRFAYASEHGCWLCSLSTALGQCKYEYIHVCIKYRLNGISVGGICCRHFYSSGKAIFNVISVG